MNHIIHSGENEIGATCIEIYTTKTRILIDCGKPLEDPERLPPSVPGVFAEGTPPNALILTHAHPDHYGWLSKMPDTIPIYMNKRTSKMLMASKLFTGSEDADIPRERQRELIEGQPLQIGEDLCITALPVDHSAFGAVGILVEGNGQRFFYTGDFRAHGKKQGMHQDLIATLKKKPLDRLFIEGTNLSRTDVPRTCEEDLKPRFMEVLERKLPTWVYFSPQNADRFAVLISAARTAKRTLVLDPYSAFVLHLLASESKGFPKPASEGIRVLVPADFKKHHCLKNVRYTAISKEEIEHNPEKYLVLFRPSILRPSAEWLTISPQLQLIYSAWRGYLENPEWQSVQTSLTSAQGTLEPIHTSGHIHPKDWQHFVDSVPVSKQQITIVHKKGEKIV